MTSVITTRRAREQDWQVLWPLLQGMGVADDEDSVRARFDGLLRHEAWLVELGEVDGAVVGYAAAQDDGEQAPFYERLGYHGESCPQPDYPEFEVAFFEG